MILVRFICIFFLLAVPFFTIFSCGLKGRKYSSSIWRFSKVGWKDENVYRIQTYGQWDRDRYSVKVKVDDSLRVTPSKIFPILDESKKDKSKGKIEKDFQELRADAKVAAKVRAVKIFREEMIFYLEKASKIKDRPLISEILDSSLENSPVSLEVVKEKYSKDHDAFMVFHVHRESLKATVDKMVDEIVRKSQEKEEKIANEKAKIAEEEAKITDEKAKKLDEDAKKLDEDAKTKE